MMFSVLNKRIGYYIIKRKYFKKPNPIRNFNNFFSKAINVLILMPMKDLSFSDANKILELLIRGNKNITLFLPEHKINLIGGKNKFNFIGFTPDDISKFDLPSKNLLGKFENMNFDIAIDLTESYSNFFTGVLLGVKAEFRIGFKKKNLEKRYNFLVNFDERNTEKSFGNLVNSLQMF